MGTRMSLTEAIRIALVADNKGATQSISFERPLAQLVASGQVSLHWITEGDLQAAGKGIKNVLGGRDRAMHAWLRDRWSAIAPHAVIFSRWGGPCSEHMFEWIDAQGLPTIGHLDDDLFDVPMELGEDRYRRYHNPDRLHSLRYVLERVRLVYASTAVLCERLRARGIHNRMVHGDIYCSSDPAEVSCSTVNEIPVAGYMGSFGHGHDLAMALPGIETFLDTYSSARFELFGTIPMPDRLVRYGSRIVHHRMEGKYQEFRVRLRELPWQIGLAPLRQTEFNAVKADTKWVEYASAGMVCLASDHPVYRPCCADGAGRLISDGAWQQALVDIYKEKHLQAEIRAQATEKLRTRYSTQTLTRQVLAICAQAGFPDLGVQHVEKQRS